MLPDCLYAWCLHPRVFLAAARRRRPLLPGVSSLRDPVRIRLEEHAARGCRAGARCHRETLLKFSRRLNRKTRLTLRLLVELEPAYRVFLRNLSDTLRSIPPRAHEFRTLSFWREVFFDSGLPWRRFGQSLLGHAVVLTLVLIVSQSWTQDQPLRRSPFENTHLTYYKPDGSYPALRGNPAPVQRAYRKQIDSARRGSIRVAPERAQAAIKAPDIKLKGPARPNAWPRISWPRTRFFPRCRWRPPGLRDSADLRVRLR